MLARPGCAVVVRLLTMSKLWSHDVNPIDSLCARMQHLCVSLISNTLQQGSVRASRWRSWPISQSAALCAPHKYTNYDDYLLIIQMQVLCILVHEFLRMCLSMFSQRLHGLSSSCYILIIWQANPAQIGALPYICRFAICNKKFNEE